VTSTLEIIGITKRYGPLVANDDVTLTCDGGTVHAIVGENGAGKTTLVSILAGETAPDAGTIQLDGTPLPLGDARSHAERGIGLVHQEHLVFPQLAVWENLCLSIPQGVFLDRRAVEEKAAAAAKRLGISIPMAARVGDLSVGARQQVEMLRVLMRDPSVLILDEPTALLSPVEAKRLLAHVRELAAEGRLVVFITHKIGEVVEVADRVTVMSRGRVAGTLAVGEGAKEKILAMMVGGEEAAAPSSVREVRAVQEEARTVLEFADASGQVGTEKLTGATFSVRAGEIVAVAGPSGNGQAAIFEYAVGREAPASGRILWQGKSASAAELHRRMAEQAVVADDRQGKAAVPSFTLRENYLLSAAMLRQNTKAGLIDADTADKSAAKAADDFGVRFESLSQSLSSLSGGNQQKLIIARELGKLPSFVAAFEPTRGLDVRTSAFVRRSLSEMRGAGAAILLLTTDFDEAVEIADRIFAISRGVVREVPPADMTVAALTSAVVGG